MSDAEPTLEQLSAKFRQSDRSAYLEQRIFVYSPFGTLVTTLILFALAAGSYALLASLDNRPILVQQNDGVTLDTQARVAFILSLLSAVILGMQRYVRMAERAEMIRAAGIFRGGLASVARLGVLTPTNAHLGMATLVGLIIGLVIVLLFLDPANGLHTAPGVFLWSATATVLLTMSFTRGVELTRRGSQNGNAMIDEDLIIDLLRIDRLSFLGRSAGRFALIWFSVTAVSCLFFVSAGVTASTVSLIVVMAAIGLWSFVGLMERVHRRILVAKAEELERLRRLIDGVRDDAVSNGDASERLQGLLAYEARIAAAQEWPLDQTTLMRVGASVFILTVPWFGQAIAAYLIEHMGAH